MSQDRISGFSDRLTEDDYLIATAKDQVSQAEGQTPLPCITGLSTRDSPDSRPNDFSPVSNPPSASILPENRETEDLREQRSYDAKITLTEGAKSDLHWWASEMEKQNGRNLQILQ